MNPSHIETASLEIERFDSGICQITFNRPAKLNALDWPSMRAFKSAIEDLMRDCESEDLDRAPRMVVLTGAGERAFCSGGDQEKLHTFLSRKDGEALAGTMGDALRLLEELPIPSLAAVNGFALGGGSEIALACDLRVVDENVKFGLVHARLGLIPGWGAGQRLLRLVGPGRAAEMMFSAGAYGADELKAMGLTSQISPPGKALEVAMQMAQKIAALDPATVRSIKALLKAGREQAYSQALDFERSMFPELWCADAHVKAVERFLAGKKNL